MHATTEQLLEIKDGLDNASSQHVAECKQCQYELSCIRALQRDMYETALIPPPSGAWASIQAAANSNAGSGIVKEVHAGFWQAAVSNSPKVQWNSLSTAVYTLALSVLMTGFIGLYIFQQQTLSQQKTEVLQASIEELMWSSRGLENVLQRVASQNELLTATERTLADRLYWRLTNVDQMINENNGVNEPDSEKIKVLWGDRINALTELNRLYDGGRENTLGTPEI